MLVNAQMYIDEVLQTKVRQSAVDNFGQDHNGDTDFIFQQDGAPCHTAKVCQTWFMENKIKLLELPGNNPDLNLIENL